MSTSAPAYRPTLQIADELQLAFDHFNRALFDGALPPCLITLQRQARCYGYFSSERFGHHNGDRTDEIAMNPEYFCMGLMEVLQTIVHEMVHMWQHHFGKPSRRTYHNTEWADRMEAIGLMPSSTGKPGGKRTGEKVADYAIPGGRFEAACDELLSRNYQVSWFDRFPPPAAAALAAANAISLPEMAAMFSPGAVIAEGPATDSSNRSKYRCPLCKAQVWGKPSLQIGCLPCGVPFEKVVKKVASVEQQPNA